MAHHGGRQPVPKMGLCRHQPEDAGRQHEPGIWFCESTEGCGKRNSHDAPKKTTSDQSACSMREKVRYPKEKHQKTNGKSVPRFGADRERDKPDGKGTGDRRP